MPDPKPPWLMTDEELKNMARESWQRSRALALQTGSPWARAIPEKLPDLPDVHILERKSLVLDHVTAALIALVLAVRKELRDAGLYDLADRIRARLADIGIGLTDQRHCTTWRL